ncbi:MAG: hypothetical protein ABI759_14440 [Candidatus Solibacter sp.]
MRTCHAVCCLAFLSAMVPCAVAQKYTGPPPPANDVPYLKHAENLIPIEVTEAKEEKGKKDDITYVVAGEASTVRTPLASPILILVTDKVEAAKLELYKFEVRNGRRELTVSPKKPPKTYRVELTRLNTAKLYQLEVDDSLEPGEYGLSAEGSNQVFCFQVF